MKMSTKILMALDIGDFPGVGKASRKNYA